MKAPRYHKCEACGQIYRCPDCLAIFDPRTKSVRLYAKPARYPAYACDFRCPEHKAKKPEKVSA